MHASVLPYSGCSKKNRAYKASSCKKVFSRATILYKCRVRE